MDTDDTKTWVQKVWRAWHSGLGKRRSLSVYDEFEAHVTQSITAAFARESTAVILGWFTSILESLDVALNKPFKDGVRKRWMEWMVDGIHEFTASGRQKKTLRRINRFKDCRSMEWHTEMVGSSFPKCGITNNLDGSEDDLVYENNDELIDDDSFAREMFESWNQ